MLKNVFASLLLAVLTLTGCSEEPRRAESQSVDSGESVDTKIIVALGDSLTAGFGVAPDESYPAVLEKVLLEKGYNYKVINAGVSGETSSGTLARVGWILTQNPDIVIVETGANDGLRGTPVTLLEDNLREIVTLFQERKVAVLLAGMKMTYNLGPTYVSQFNEVYPRVAEEMDVELMPFFLAEVATKSHLNIDDGIHPNHAGYTVIVENLYPYLARVIDSVNP